MPEAKMATVTAIADRAVYATRKHRAEDLVRGDVTRNRFGKWDVVEKIRIHDDGRYVTISFEVGGEYVVRTVHLADVQVVKAS